MTTSADIIQDAGTALTGYVMTAAILLVLAPPVTASVLIAILGCTMCGILSRPARRMVGIASPVLAGIFMMLWFAIPALVAWLALGRVNAELIAILWGSAAASLPVLVSWLYARQKVPGADETFWIISCGLGAIGASPLLSTLALVANLPWVAAIAVVCSMASGVAMIVIGDRVVMTGNMRVRDCKRLGISA